MSLITARNEVGARLCFYTCLWFCSGGGWVVISACIAGGISACLAAGLGGGGGVPAYLAGLQAHTQGGSWGVWPGGSPLPHLGGVSRPTPVGGCVSRPTPGGIPACTEADLPPHPRRLLLRAVRILLECILVNYNITENSWWVPSSC